MARKRHAPGSALALFALLIALGLAIYGVAWGQWWMWVTGLALFVWSASMLRQQRRSRRPRPTSSID